MNQLNTIIQCFYAMDTDKNGYLSRREILEVLKRSGLSFDRAKALVQACDKYFFSNI
jgi:Ca2+-binding EF-hand superfamily protein